MQYLIWSIKHNGWWNPNREGYTSDKSKAGRYTHEEAIAITIRSNIGTNRPNSALVPDDGK